MNFKEATQLAAQSSFTPEQFWFALNIYVRKPNSVSRRLCGSVPLFHGIVVNSHAHDIEELFTKVVTANVFDKSPDEISELLKGEGIELETCGEQREADDGMCSITINRLLPRNCDQHRSCLELIIRDKERGVATFAKLNPDDDDEKPFVATRYPFSIQLVGEEIQLIAHVSQPEEHHVLWLQTHLFPKLVKWASSSALPQGTDSLNLVSMDSYNDLYQQLKKKYGKHMVDIWPEVTDPAKFVYEDVAIATYLLLLWEKERVEKGWPADKKQSFVDLGCGNGLLVYILSSEGHPGIGLDVRKRGIWDCYPETTKLEVRSINPSEDCNFPGYDWLIGNHSDELTPWIPVWASRSSYNCSFFLLPCCFFDFSGNKYQRQDTSQSQYGDYLNYVHRICLKCGFHTAVDKLRIPSTKRTCLVGSSRTYQLKDHEQMECVINSMIKSRCVNQSPCNIRQPIETVRNCTQLKKGVVEEVIKIVTSILLQETANKGDEWNAGGRKSLRELAQTIPKETLQELKREFGGLQTLLKNNRFIFEVLDGCVQLRKPSCKSALEVRNLPASPKKRRTGYNMKERLLKQKPCWFNEHHPNGCPLSAIDCPNVH